MHRHGRFSHDQRIYLWIYLIGLITAVTLATIIGLLVWQLMTPMYSNNQTNWTCPPNPCLLTTSAGPISTSRNTTSSPISSTSTMTIQTSVSITSSLSTKPNTDKKRTYRESCEQLYDCYVEYGLLCEYGWNETRSCLCEGSHYWSAQENKCLRKGEINDLCQIDYQCHREIGLVCDKPPGSLRKICVCAASIYWAKDSNCGQTSIRRLVDCIDENYATTCLVLGMNNIYHMMTIRSITEKELSFDWFLIDNRILLELPQLSCAFNNDTKYCFGLSTQEPQHSLQLAQFTRKGFHSIENIGGNNRGTAFGLKNINSVSVFVRKSQNTLYRHIIANDEILSAHDIASSLSGDPMCYVYEVLPNRQTHCFARNALNTLSEYVELSANAWRTTQLGNPTDRIRDEIVPVCSYVGSIHRYCFAVFENGQIYRILSKSGVWSAWQLTGGGRIQQFLTHPTFLTSKSLNQSSPDQTCYLIAIDKDSYLQLSINTNCALVDNFSEWTLALGSRKFKQIDKTFRLRDGNVGVLGIDDQNQLYYLFLDPKTNRFTLPRPALTVKAEQFRPYERIGIERALPMFLLGIGCVSVTAIVFGILYGNMIRTRRAAEKIQRENEAQQMNPSISIIQSHNTNSLKFPISSPNNKIHNSNQNPSFNSSTTNMTIAFDPVFKHHPHYPYFVKRIIEL